VALYTEELFSRTPARLLRLLPAGATVAGWDSHPLEDRAFARRTVFLRASLHRSRGGGHESLDLQILLQRFEKISTT
jgi:hypothetical protein